MWTHPLSIRREEPAPNVAVFYVEGNLYGNKAGYAFQLEVRKRFQEVGGRVIIDLENVDHIDSSGIGILAACVVSAKNAGGQITLSAPNHRVKKLLALVWPLDFVEQASSVEAALSASS